MEISLATRDEMLARLNGIGEYCYDWDDLTSGYGVWCCRYWLSGDGLYGPLSMTCAEETLTEDEYTLAKQYIEAGENVDEEAYGSLSSAVIELVRDGYEPGEKYCVNSDGGYYFIDDAMSEIVAMGGMTSWDDMNDDELRHWCTVLNHIGHGITSAYQLLDKEKP